MTDKFFPIHTDTSCQLKWTWSTIHLYTGESNSCHRCRPQTIDPDDFGSFHNLDKKIADRKTMLNGQWPVGGCEYCQRIEDAGGMSDRQFQKQIPNLSPPELDIDSNAVIVTPRIVEVYLNNVCNMSCIYCEDKFSSKIAQENIQHGEFVYKDLHIKNQSVKTEHFERMSMDFWNWLDQHYSDIRRLHILGGEPFFQDEFQTCLEFLETHSNTDLEFNIISNLKIPHSKLVKFVEQIKQLVVERKIKRFDLTASIDCWGKEQEYIRYGLDFEQWKQNFEYLVEQKWITLNINQTITSLSLKSTVELINYINKLQQFRKIGHYFMYCAKPSYFNPAIFPKHFFDTDIDAIINAMKNNTWQSTHAYNMMVGFKKYFNNNDLNPSEIEKLIVYLNEIDRRRGLNWKMLFPWLQEFEYVVQ